MNNSKQKEDPPVASSNPEQLEFIGGLRRSKRPPLKSRYQREGIWITMESQFKNPNYVGFEDIKEWRNQ
jgi:hypothetical protein